jgi:hypothetical protein
VEYDSGFTLFPGKYSIKFLARDDETGRIGTFNTTFIIPDLNKVTKRLAISSVVLSSQRVALNDALYNATRGKEQAKGDAANPLVQDGQKLIPSVTRVFNRDREMYIYLQAYQKDIATPAAPLQASTSGAGAAAPAAIDSTAPLFAWVTFYRDQKMAYETPPVAMTSLPATRLGIVPLSFHIGLGSLAPGQYQCQISVLDPANHRAAFWQGSIMVVQ